MQRKRLLHLKHFYFIKSLSDVKNAHIVTFQGSCITIIFNTQDKMRLGFGEGAKQGEHLRAEFKSNSAG